MNKRLGLLLLGCLLSLAAMAQGISIQGVVKDETGNPAAGAMVQETGTTNGTATDAQGRFTLQVQPGAALRVTYMGYQGWQSAVGQRRTFDITLQPEVMTLDQVVVVGYGTAEKKTLTGAISQIGADAISTTKSVSTVTSIQGKVPGVMIRQNNGEPGTYSAQLNVRGYGLAPLIVIDGVLTTDNTALGKMNPDDIESISVLKDASAAIYGINADGGVIIVTTKKGRLNQQGKVSYNGYFGIQQPTGMRKTVDAFTFRAMQNEMSRNTDGKPMYNDAELIKWYDQTEPGYQDFNWMDEMYKDFSTNQRHTITVNGGSDKVSYYISGGYTSDEGLLVSDIQQYHKYDFRGNVTAQVFRNLKADLTFSGRFDDNKQPINGYLWLFKPIANANRGYTPWTMADRMHMAQVAGAEINPYAAMSEDIAGAYKTKSMIYNTNLNLTYDVPWVQGLQLRAQGILESRQGNSYTLNKGYQLYDFRSDEPVGSPAKTTYNTGYSKTTWMDFQAQVLYKNRFCDAHNVSGTLVWEAVRADSEYMTAGREYDLYLFDIIDQGNEEVNLSNSGSRSQERMLSFLGRFNYDYKGKYIAEFLFRYDGTFRYAKNHRWIFSPAASLGWRLSEENFIKDNLPFVDNLKLRASFGQMGFENQSRPFEWLSGYELSRMSQYVFTEGVPTTGLKPPGVINPDYTWTSTYTTDIGIDASLWNEKLGLTFDVFRKDWRGIPGYLTGTVPNTFGAEFPQVNLNAQRYEGMEIEVSHANTVGQVWYRVSANATYSRKKILKNVKQPYSSSMERWRDIYAEGRYVGHWWGYDQLGQYTHINQFAEAPLMDMRKMYGNSKGLPGTAIIRDANGDGKIDGNDEVPIFWRGQMNLGTPSPEAYNPPLQYGMTIDVKWKNLDFNMLLQGAALYTIYTNHWDHWGYANQTKLWETYLDRWHTADPYADRTDPNTQWIPGKWTALRLNAGGTTDEYPTQEWYLDAKYLRIKSIELGFTLPKRWTSKLGIENVRVFGNVLNPYTFCNREVRDFDPEKEESAYSANLAYFLMRSYNFGLNVTF